MSKVEGLVLFLWFAIFWRATLDGIDLWLLERRDRKDRSNG